MCMHQSGFCDKLLRRTPLTGSCCKVFTELRSPAAGQQPHGYPPKRGSRVRGLSAFSTVVKTPKIALHGYPIVRGSRVAGFLASAVGVSPPAWGQKTLYTATPCFGVAVLRVFPPLHGYLVFWGSRVVGFLASAVCLLASGVGPDNAFTRLPLFWG